MKDHDKYVYVEIALPKDNQAVQNLLARSERTTTPLRVLVKEATILAYADEEESDMLRVKPVKKSGKKRTGKIKGQWLLMLQRSQPIASLMIWDFNCEHKGGA